jgi:hypothetical protein
MMQGFEDRNVYASIVKRTIKVLRNGGYLNKEGEPCEFPAKLDPNFDAPSSLADAAFASSRNRIAFGPRAGQMVGCLGPAFGYEEEIPFVVSTRCASMNGFTLHANRYIGSKQRAELYSLISCVARPALSKKRLTRQAGPDEARSGDLLYELKSRWRYGTSHIVLSPSELVERFFALVPPPRSHLTRYFGVLSSHSKVRKHIILDPEVKKGYLREKGDGKSNSRGRNC